MSESDSECQVEVYFSGRVQGVGFRYTVLQIAQDLGITGYVRNLHDGRVHLLAQGTQKRIDELMSRIRTSRLERGIKSMTLNQTQTTVPLERFTLEKTE